MTKVYSIAVLFLVLSACSSETKPPSAGDAGSDAASVKDSAPEAAAACIAKGATCIFDKDTCCEGSCSGFSDPAGPPSKEGNCY
jgi:Conotoxin